MIFKDLLISVLSKFNDVNHNGETLGVSISTDSAEVTTTDSRMVCIVNLYDGSVTGNDLALKFTVATAIIYKLSNVIGNNPSM